MTTTRTRTRQAPRSNPYTLSEARFISTASRDFSRRFETAHAQWCGKGAKPTQFTRTAEAGQPGLAPDVAPVDPPPSVTVTVVRSGRPGARGDHPSRSPPPEDSDLETDDNVSVSDLHSDPSEPASNYTPSQPSSSDELDEIKPEPEQPSFCPKRALEPHDPTEECVFEVWRSEWIAEYEYEYEHTPDEYEYDHTPDDSESEDSDSDDNASDSPLQLGHKPHFLSKVLWNLDDVWCECRPHIAHLRLPANQTDLETFNAMVHSVVVPRGGWGEVGRSSGRPPTGAKGSTKK